MIWRDTNLGFVEASFWPSFLHDPSEAVLEILCVRVCEEEGVIQ